MEPKRITEKDGVHKAWYDEARKVDTPEKLAEFVRRLTTEYRHDYGTICHAVAAAALAGAYTVEHAPCGGITGFQSGAVMWEFIRTWNHVDCPARLLKMEDLLYPQYQDRFTTITPDTWKWLQEEAAKKLLEFGPPGSDTVHPNVRRHIESIVDGRVPFGLGVEES